MTDDCYSKIFYQFHQKNSYLSLLISTDLVYFSAQQNRWSVRCREVFIWLMFLFNFLVATSNHWKNRSKMTSNRHCDHKLFLSFSHCDFKLASLACLIIKMITIWDIIDILTNFLPTQSSPTNDLLCRGWRVNHRPSVAMLKVIMEKILFILCMFSHKLDFLSPNMSWSA